MNKERPIHSLEETDEKRAAFFAAWKRGVERLGPELFGPGSLEKARAKTELEPRRESIDTAFDHLSRGQQQLLGAMVSFFDPDWGEELAARTEDEKCLCALTFNLDKDEMEIVCDLLRNYTGWDKLDPPVAG